MRIENPDERRFYEIEIAENAWSFREFQRQYDSALFERLALSRNKKKVRELAEKGQIISSPQDLFKDPYILELGKGFAYIGRQVHFTYEEEFFLSIWFFTTACLNALF